MNIKKGGILKKIGVHQKRGGWGGGGSEKIGEHKKRGDSEKIGEHQNLLTVYMYGNITTIKSYIFATSTLFVLKTRDKFCQLFNWFPC